MIFKVLYNITNEIAEFRKEVFVIEQHIDINEEFNCDENERIHCCCFLDDMLVAYVRMNKIYNGVGHIGRVAVKKEYRNKGYGKAIVSYAEQVAKSFSCNIIDVHAQIQVCSFYEKLGYMRYGTEFIEVERPHIKMIKEIR
ncbi:MAG: GNAT family N-acetyltransferase [Nitrososphaerota archaeon]|jgi:predicted GNAT family N-acyltransferase|nr:GNAT family N-acetyltransferase [Nitrososphaerota archaeon]